MEAHAAAAVADLLSELSEEDQQRISFAYGNTKLSNPDVTMGMVLRAVFDKNAVAARRAAFEEAAKWCDTQSSMKESHFFAQMIRARAAEEGSDDG
jgi:hypothetical protein